MGKVGDRSERGWEKMSLSSESLEGISLLTLSKRWRHGLIKVYKYHHNKIILYAKDLLHLVEKHSRNQRLEAEAKQIHTKKPRHALLIVRAINPGNYLPKSRVGFSVSWCFQIKIGCLPSRDALGKPLWKGSKVRHNSPWYTIRPVDWMILLLLLTGCISASKLKRQDPGPDSRTWSPTLLNC